MSLIRGFRYRAPGIVVVVGATVPRALVGTNLSSYYRYSAEPGTLNLLCDSNEQPGYPVFSLVSENGYGTTEAALGTDGWPAADFVAGVRAGPNENYTIYVTFTGQASSVVAVAYGTNINSISTLSYNSGTNTTSFTIDYRWTSSVVAKLQFNGTKRLSTDSPGTGVTNLVFCRSEDVAYVGTRQWSQKFIDYVQNFSALRTMDLGFTNGNTGAHSTPLTFRKDSSASVDKIVALANDTGKDVWYNIPINCDDAWLAAVFTYIDANLDPARHIYLEYSNEVWNTSGGFSQTYWSWDQVLIELQGAYNDTPYNRVTRNCSSWTRTSGTLRLQLGFSPTGWVVGRNYYLNVAGNAGRSAAITAVSTGSNWVEFADAQADGSGAGGSNEYLLCADTGSNLLYGPDQWNMIYLSRRRQGRRVVQISDICRTAVGDSKMMTRFRPLLEFWLSDENGSRELDWVAYLAGGNANVKNKIYGAGAAPYYGLDEPLSSDSATTHTASEYVTGLASNVTSGNNWIPYQNRKIYTLKYGIKLTLYEGGPDTSVNKGTTNNLATHAARLLSGMHDVNYGYLMGLGSELGADVFMHFKSDLVSSSDTSPNCWGFTDSLTNNTGMWQSFADYRDAAAGSILKVNQIGGAVGSTTTRDVRRVAGIRDTTDVSGNAYNTFHDGNGTLSWLFWSDYPGTYSLTFNYAYNDASNPGSAWDVPGWFNEATLTMHCLNTGTNLSTGSAFQTITGVAVQQGWNSLEMETANYVSFVMMKGNLSFYRTA